MTASQIKLAGTTRYNESCRILIAEDDINYRQWLLGCRAWDYEPSFINDHDELIAELTANPEAVLIMGLGFGTATGFGGLSVYGNLLLEGFGPRVIFLADSRSPELADRAVRMGAHDIIERSSELQPLMRAISLLTRPSVVRLNSGTPLLGESSAIKELRELIRDVAVTDAAVMITGESGTGKELVAKAIHDCSHRALQDYVAVNMAALPESLVESVLFGHEKGAFTGADQRRAGMCEQADGGTLFLDEIGEMNRELQPKLLRFLQEYTVQRVGSTKVQKVDTRIISATNRSLSDLLKPGGLREDVFFRLHVVPIHVPPLRERREDIPLLANAFLARKCQKTGRPSSFSPAVLDRFCEYSWPGNIRQLENLVERLAATARVDEISLELIPAELFCTSAGSVAHQAFNGRAAVESSEVTVVSDRTLTRMESAERRLIIDALKRHDGNVGAAARFLGIGQATIYRKIRSLGISRRSVRDNGAWT